MLLQPLVTDRNLSNRPIRFCMHLLFHKISNLTLRTALILTRNRQNMASKCVHITQSMPSKIIRICINLFRKIRDPNCELMLLQPLVTGRNLSNRPIRFFCMHLLFHKISNLTLRTALFLIGNRQNWVSKCVPRTQSLL